MSMGSSTASVWKASRNGRILPVEIKTNNNFRNQLYPQHVLVTVRSNGLTSTFSAPPHSRSSHVGLGVSLSATRTQPISSQSFVQALGVPAVPPPTIALTTVLEFPDSVNDLDRLLAIDKQVCLHYIQNWNNLSHLHWSGHTWYWMLQKFLSVRIHTL